MSVSALLKQLGVVAGDSLSYFAVQQELDGAIERYQSHNKLRGVKKFRARCLSGGPQAEQQATPSGSMDTYYPIKVRIEKIHASILDDPCGPAYAGSGSTGEANKVISLHPTAYSLRPMIAGERTPGFGEEIICEFFDAHPENNGKMRGIRYHYPKQSATYDYKCANETLQGLVGKFQNGPALMSNYQSSETHSPGPPPHAWKDKWIQGSEFPDGKITSDKNIRLNKTMKEKYLPAMERALAGQPLGLKLLATIMAVKEGFYPNTRSYKYNNPGNIGNTDSGKNKGYETLEDGIKKQMTYILSVANGTHRAYPLGKEKKIKPYFSKEIARNQKTYGGKSPYLPGYIFTYTGQIDQYVKIYSTGARGGNSYVSMILSYFKQNGFTITPQSKIQDIIKLNK